MRKTLLRLFVVVLAISCLLTCFVGCGADEDPEIASEDEKQELAGGIIEDVPEVIEEEPPPVILYPGAPVITIEKTAFNGWEGKNDPSLHYRLKAEDPLPYDIKVRISVRRTYIVDGWLYGDVDESKELEVDKVIEMRKDRLTYEDSIEGGSQTRIQTRTLQILPWKGPGDDPYNVGRPSRLKIARKPPEGKVVPKIVSVEPPSGSEIAINDVVTVTFDGKPSDAKVFSNFQSFNDPWARNDGIAPPEMKINDNVIILTGFPPGYKTDLRITWGSGRTSQELRYQVPAELSIVNVNPPDKSEIKEEDSFTITFDAPPQDVIQAVTFEGMSGDRVVFDNLIYHLGNWRGQKGEMTSTLNGKQLILTFTDTTPVWPGRVQIDLKYAGRKRPDVYSNVTLEYHIKSLTPIKILSIDPLSVQEGEPTTITLTFNKAPPGIQILPDSFPFHWSFPIKSDFFNRRRSEMEPQPNFTEHRSSKIFTIELPNGVGEIVDDENLKQIDKRRVDKITFPIVFAGTHLGRSVWWREWIHLELVFTPGRFRIDSPEGLTAVWLFDEGIGNEILDSSGNKLDGRIDGDARWVEGKFGTALEFTGQGPGVVIENDIAFNFQESMTVTGWFYLNDPVIDRPLITKKDSFSVGFLGDFGWLEFVIQPDNTTSFDLFPFNRALRKWHHFAVTFDWRRGTTFYINGDKKSWWGGKNNVLVPSEADLMIGGFPGIVDEVALYNRVLSKNEIIEIMENGFVH